jgi:hypothetical protein
VNEERLAQETLVGCGYGLIVRVPNADNLLALDKDVPAGVPFGQ